MGSRPTPVFRLLHEYKGPAAAQSLESPSVKPLYGRVQELEFLEQRWGLVVAGTGQSILLTGEPGIGKSRLVQELTKQLQSTPQILLECRCAPEGRNSALYPVVDLLERLLGVSHERAPEQALAAIEALLSRHGIDPSEAMPLFLRLLSVKAGVERYPPLRVAPQRAKELTLEALLGLFFAMAQQQPMLLLVEDLHWADPTTLELLTHFVKDVSSVRICLVLTARPEFSAPWTTAHHLQLGRLGRQQVEEMVRGLTQDKPLPREVVEKLLERTDGVPLFVEELTRVVMESLDSWTDSPSRLRSPVQVSIPSTLRDSLMARLDRLGPARELAQLAAALGREFSYEVLRSISPRQEPELQHELKMLADADLVYRRRGVRNPTYVFKHALIRDTAYESMLKPLRRQVHSRIASVLEAHFPEVTETRPELLAMHHAAADQKRQALGYAQRAGMAALARSANHETVSYITEALSWLQAVDDERERAQFELELNGILTPALMVIRGWSDGRIKKLVARSQQLIDFLGDTPQTVPTLWSLWLYHNARGHRARARALAERLLAMADQAENTDLTLMSLAGLGNGAINEGRLLDAHRHFERVLTLYDPSKHMVLAGLYGQDARSWAEGLMSCVKWLVGYPDQADTRSKVALSWAHETKHTSSLGLAYFYRLKVLQWRGEREKLLAEASVALDVTRQYGLPTHTALCQMLWSWGRRDAAGLRQAIAFQSSIGMELGKGYGHHLLAEVEIDAGRCEAALEVIEEVLSWGPSSGENYMIPEMLRLKGLCLRAQGDGGGYETLLRQAIRIAQAQAARMLELRATYALCELLRDRGLAAAARELLIPLVEWFTEGFETPDIARARALLEALRQASSPLRPEECPG
jgi:TOMM system kinase/cyclase fusion protein